MAKRSKKKTTVYSKERKRIYSTIYRLKKKGYTSDLYFPTENELRKQGIKGKELARLTRELKKWTSKDITSYIKMENVEDVGSDYVNYDSFPSEADIIIQNFRSDVIARFPENAGPILSDWLDRLLSLYSKEDVAQMLNDAAENGVTIDYKVAYNNDLLMGTIADFMEFLPEASEGVKQDLMDAIEYNEDWELPE